MKKHNPTSVTTEQQNTRIVSCPTCKKSVAWNTHNECKPFCSQRCRLIDLGEWASESNRIAGERLDPETTKSLMNDYNSDHEN